MMKLGSRVRSLVPVTVTAPYGRRVVLCAGIVGTVEQIEPSGDVLARFTSGKYLEGLVPLRPYEYERTSR